jgi:hypothetical protein
MQFCSPQWNVSFLSCSGSSFTKRITQSHLSQKEIDMKTGYRFAFVLILILLTISFDSPAQTGWEYAGGLPEHTFTALACSSQGVLLAANRGQTIYRTNDHGDTWETLPIGIPNLRCTALAFGKNDIAFMGSGNQGLFRSTDLGKTWQPTALTGVSVSCIAITADGSLYADSAAFVVIHSTDDGATWTSSRSRMFGNILAIACGAAGEVWTVNGDESVYFSPNMGEDWTPVWHAQKLTDIKISPDGTIILMYGNNPFVSVSTDGGTSWKNEGGPGRTNFIVEAIGAHPDGRLFIGYGFDNTGIDFGGVYSSSNDGATWIDANDGLMTSGNNRSKIMTFAFGSNGEMLVGTDGTGIYRSTGSGPWEHIDPSLPIDTKQRYGYAPEFVSNHITALSNGVVLASVVGSGVFGTLDSGRTWNALNQGLPGREISVMTASNSGYTFVTINRSGIYRIGRKGQSWENVTPPFPGVDTLSVICLASGEVFAANNKDFLFRSTDDGTTWVKVSDAGITYGITYLVAGKGGTLAALGSNGALRSTDAGLHWIPAGYPDFGRFTPGDLKINSKGDLFWAGYYLGLPPWDGQVFRNKAGSASWENLFAGGPSTGISAVLSMDIDAMDRLFIGTRVGVYFSLDDGTTWLPSDGSPTEVFSLSSAQDGILFAGCGEGADRNVSPIPHGVLGCALTTTPQDTLHYLSAQKDYEGLPSSKGAYNVFSVDLTLLNTGAATALGLSGALDIPAWMIVDTIVSGLPASLAAGDQAQLRILCRALPDTVQRIATMTYTIASANADTIRCSIPLVVQGTRSMTPVVSIGQASDFMLEQNYPNPFSRTTTISYRLPAETDALVTVQDMLGRTLRTLVNERQSAGSHEVVFQVKDLPEGLYTYRLMTKSGVRTGKMILLR